MWIIIVGLVFSGLIVIWHHSEFYRSHKNNSGGIINCDGFMREFCYRVDKSKAEIWTLLISNNTYTATKYRFNGEQGIITFYSELPDGYLDISYVIKIAEYEGYSLMKVTQFDHMWTQNKYAWLQNEFWRQKLDAMPVAYMREI